MTEPSNIATGGKILVVDDTGANLQLLTNLLREHDYTVHPASDGELALEIVQLQCPDLILLDIRMPGMDGYEVCRRLKADERTRDIPIIFISILEDERDKVTGFRAGGVDYITKPFQPEEVLARIQTHLRLKELTERLEQTVTARTAELEAANRALEAEVAERKRAEETLSRLNRELRAISNCNQVLMKATDEASLLAEICRIVCDDAGYRMAWVGYAEGDDAKTIRLAARGGADDGYLDEAKLTWSDTERGRGPAGVSIRRGRPDCSQDFAIDPRMAPWRENALQRGYRSCISLPLKDETESAFGALCIYSTEANTFTPDEIRLLEELAGDLAYGIIALRARVERERAEYALRLSDVRFGELFNKAAIPLCFVNKREGTLAFNARFAETFGYSHEEVPSLDAWWQVAYPDPGYRAQVLDMCVAALQRAAVNKTDVEPLEYRVTCKNGDLLTMVVFGSYIDDDLLLTFFDVTERKQTEDTLFFIAQLGWGRSTGDYLTALARYLGETLVMDYVVIDRLVADAPGVAETAALYAKGALLPSMRYGLKGTPCNEVMGKKLCCFPQNVRQLFPDDTLLADMGAESYAGIPLWDSEGHPVGLIAVMDGKPFHDEIRVTHILQLVATSAAAALERERTDGLLRERERTLATSESRFRRLAENAPDAIYRMSLPDGIYEYMSPAALELFGYAPEEFYAVPGLVRELIHPDWQAYFAAGWAKLLQGDMPPSYEFQIVHRSGAVRWMNQRNILVRNDDGRIIAIEGIVTDITERRQAEEILRRLKDELEQRVLERTAELEEKNAELERMNRIFVGREIRMVELKERIRELERGQTR